MKFLKSIIAMVALLAIASVSAKVMKRSTEATITQPTKPITKPLPGIPSRPTPKPLPGLPTKLSAQGTTLINEYKKTVDFNSIDTVVKSFINTVNSRKLSDNEKINILESAANIFEKSATTNINALRNAQQQITGEPLNMQEFFYGNQ